MAGKPHPLVTHTLVPLLVLAAVIFLVTRFTRIETVIGDVVVTFQGVDEHIFPAPEPGGRAVAGASRTLPPAAPAEAPRNVVLIIGDGMGIGHLSTASALFHGPDGGLAMETAPTTGLVRTYNGENLVPDSASAATALATGFRTDTKMVSRLPDGREPLTLLQAAEAHGFATGVITTAGLVDATPAAFVTHAESRNDYRHILEGMVSSEIDILIGGDWQRFRKAKARPDYISAAQTVESAVDGRYTVIRDPEDLDTAPIPVLALFPARPGSRKSHGPRLALSAGYALDRLAEAANRFLLVLESEDTDEAAHEADLEGLAGAMAELDGAVAVVLDFARERGDTLVLVTADHDSAGPGVVDGEFAAGIAEVRWLTDGHTANWVPLFALGPGSDRFYGVMDNTEIPRIIGQLLGLDRFPDADGNTPSID
jgi:alkaline phosphatase